MGSRGSSMSYSSGKRWHYSTLLLLALGAAMLSVLVVHKLREGRVLGLLLHDRENQLFALQLILEKERAHSKEMKTKIEELKAKATSLRSHKMRLNTRLMEAENLAAHLKNKRSELELALQEKQTELITSLKDAEEASAKANKQQGGHAGETERRLQQPSNYQQANTAPVGKEETVANKDEGGAKEVEKTHEHGRGTSKGGGWVRIETNTDDAEPVDHAGAESSDGAEQSEVAVDQVGDRSSTPGEVISTGQKNGAVVGRGEQLPAVMKGEVATADTSTETNVVAAPEDGKAPEQKDNSTADGDQEKQTYKEDPQTENPQHGESSKTDEKQTDDQVIDGNVNSAEPAQLKVLPENQTASAQAEAAAGVQYSASSEAKSTSTESYPDTNGSDEMTNGGDGGVEQQTVSDDKESNTSEGAALHDEEAAGAENKEENNDVRSTMETGEQSAASHEGQSENVHGGEEGGSSGKEEDQLGSGQSGSEQPGEKIAGDEEKISTGAASTDLTQQQGANVDIESAEEEAANNETQQE